MQWSLKVWTSISASIDLLLLVRTKWQLISMVDMAILNDADDSLSMLQNHVLIPWPFNSVVNYAKSRIIYLSLLLFIEVVRMVLKSYSYTM